MDWKIFLDGALSVRALDYADWVGSHCYWTSEGNMFDPSDGAHYKNLLGLGKPIFITEYSNPSPVGPNREADMDVKAKQYLEWYPSLPGCPPGVCSGTSDLPATVRGGAASGCVCGAFSFVSSCSGGGFPNEAWFPSMAVIVGARPPVQTHIMDDT
jgi:hypothetical protein